MAHADVEADPLFQLLTDALRAGPGSPQWHQAVSKLREGGVEGPHAEEYKLLVAVRENLESGRDYRSVRAGPGFTRKLLENLDKEDTSRDRRRGLPTATLIAIASALVLVAVVAVVGYKVYRPGPPDPPPAESALVAELQRTDFPTELLSVNFDGPMASVPSNWPTPGRLVLEATPRGGLRPSPGAAAGASGGAVVAPEPFPPDAPFAAEVKLLLNKPRNDVIVELFVSTEPTFSPDRATSDHELVWLLGGTTQRVVVGGPEQTQEMAKADRPGDEKSDKAQPLTVRLLVGKDVAVVESNQQRLWAGPHSLPAKPRYVGVRFLRTADAGSKTTEPATVQSIRLLKK